MPNYKPLNIKEIALDNRFIISNSPNGSAEVLKGINQKNEFIVRKVIDELNVFLTMGIGFENMGYIKDYIDYVISDVMHIIDYRIINSSTDLDKICILKDFYQVADKLNGLMDFQIEQKRIQEEKSEELTVEKVTRYFSLYRTHCSKLEESLKIFDALVSEINEDEKEKPEKQIFCCMNDSYKTDIRIFKDADLSKYKNIITEDANYYNYKNKIEATREFMCIMEGYSNNHCCKNNSEDIKVYFREIYVSRVKYKRRQASTIIRDYLNKCKNNGVEPFENETYYMFVMEKINRGYYRERGQLELYCERVSFQKRLYELLLKTYLFYDFEECIEFIYIINNMILEKLIEYFSSEHVS